MLVQNRYNRLELDVVKVDYSQSAKVGKRQAAVRNAAKFALGRSSRRLKVNIDSAGQLRFKDIWGGGFRFHGSNCVSLQRAGWLV